MLARAVRRSGGRSGLQLAAGLSPLPGLENRSRLRGELLPFRVAVGANGHLEAMPTRVEEVDRLTELVIGDADNFHARGFEFLLGIEQDLFALHLECEMLHPV